MAVEAVLDSSSLVSLARAGLLHLLPKLPVTPVLLESVWQEVVGAGRAGGHADAIAVESVLSARLRRVVDPAPSVDAQVLAAAVEIGVLVANDLALGRRARNLGVTWIRSADLLVLATRTGSLAPHQARDAIAALRDSGRITADLATSYLEELG